MPIISITLLWEYTMSTSERKCKVLLRPTNYKITIKHATRTKTSENTFYSFNLVQIPPTRIIRNLKSEEFQIIYISVYLNYSFKLELLCGKLIIKIFQL